VVRYYLAFDAGAVSSKSKHRNSIEGLSKDKMIKVGSN
jgi:hypothetical protein